MGGIVWLASYPKSGNTWTRNFLHNLLCESSAESDGHNLNQMHIKTAWDSSLRWYEPFTNIKDFDTMTAEDCAAIRMQANEEIARTAGDGLAFVKTHNAMMLDHGVPLINPKVTAGAVYILRNPLDVAVSYRHHMNTDLDETIEIMGASGVFNRAIELMAYERHGSWSEHVNSWTRKPNRSLFIMRYEDMLDDPEQSFTALTQFLRIETTSARILKAIELSSFEKLQQKENQQGFLEKPANNEENFFRKGTKDQWRDELSETQILQIISDHREQMVRFDYIPDEYC